MKLFCFYPTGHGPLSYFVMAETKDEAVAAIKKELEKIYADNYHSSPIEDQYEYGHFYKSNGESHKLEILEPLEVAMNENE